MLSSISLKLEDGRQFHYSFAFSAEGTLRIGTQKLAGSPAQDWIGLDFCKCQGCTLEVSEYPVCPVAVILAEYAQDLGGCPSFEKVRARVCVDRDQFCSFTEMSLQTVLAEMVRLAVYQSLCPIGRQLKPVMTALKPFPENSEFLNALAGYFVKLARDQGGADPDEILRESMEQVHDCLRQLYHRLEAGNSGESMRNGVVIMSSLSLLCQLTAPELVESAVREQDGV